MKKQLTLFGAIGVILLVVTGVRGEEQISFRLKATRINDRISVQRLEMPELAETPEVVVQKVKKRGPSEAEGSARRALRASLRERKTRRVVAAQN